MAVLRSGIGIELNTCGNIRCGGKVGRENGLVGLVWDTLAAERWGDCVGGLRYLTLEIGAGVVKLRGGVAIKDK